MITNPNHGPNKRLNFIWLYSKKAVSICAVLSIIFSVFSVLPINQITGEEYCPLELSVHGTIYIEGDSQFTSGNGVVGGSGVKSNPYIIKDWSINASQQNGITIKNTTSYFVIRNCAIYNGNYGIFFLNVKNGIIENNNITLNKVGINFETTYEEFNGNNIIKNNFCSSNGGGIDIGGDCNYNYIQNNNCSNNNYTAIRLSHIYNHWVSSNHNEITNNTCYNNTGYGIFFYGSHNLIENNICNFNQLDGIYFWGGFNKINNNNCNFNRECGIWFLPVDYYSTNNSFIRNTCNYNNISGIFAGWAKGYDDTKFNKLVENICCYNNYDGITFGWYDDEFFYNVLERNICNSNNRNGMTISSDYNLIRNNTCNSNSEGIWLYYADHSYIINNTLYDNSKIGIRIEDCDKNIFRYNTMRECGIFIGGNWQSTWNSQQIDTTNTVNGKPVYYWKDRDGGVVPKNAGEVILANCSNITVHDQNLNNGTVGLQMGFTSNSIISNNSCMSNNMYGLYLCNSERNLITNNTIISNEIGLFLAGEKDLITNNTIISNEVGLYLAGEKNLIYNNYFNNSRQFEGYYNDHNTWSIEKIRCRNIVNGPYLGGNYWSDYYGKDLDFDGLGDTELPYGPGDYHPLCPPEDEIPPIIIDNTGKYPTSGDEFLFNVTAMDNSIIDEIKIEYWFDNGTHLKELFSIEHDHDLVQGVDYLLNIEVPSYAFKLKYFITAFDLNRNRNFTDIMVLDVIDNDPPELVDNTDKRPTTGDGFMFNASVHDNIKVSSAHIEFWFDDQINSKQNITLTFVDNYYQAEITISPTARTFHYLISALDNSSNWAALNIKTLNVFDNDPPTIIDLTAGEPLTGRQFNITGRVVDNRGLDKVWLRYWFDQKIQLNSTLKIDNEHFRYYLEVPVDALILYYEIGALDTTKHIAELNNSIPVKDIIPPTIYDYSESITTTGETFVIKASISDNLGVAYSLLTYWFNGTTCYFFEFNNSQVINIPDNAQQLHYIVNASDISGNIASVEKDLRVIDNDKPGIDDGSLLTNDSFDFIVISWDNIAVSEVNVEYWFDSGMNNNLTLELNNGKYQGSILILNNAATLFYKLTALDTSGNERQTLLTVITLPKYNDPEPEPGLKPEDDSEVEPGTDPETEKELKINEAQNFQFWLLVVVIISIIIILIMVMLYIYLSKKRKNNKSLKEV